MFVARSAQAVVRYFFVPGLVVDVAVAVLTMLSLLLLLLLLPTVLWVSA